MRGLGALAHSFLPTTYVKQECLAKVAVAQRSEWPHGRILNFNLRPEYC